MIKILNDHNELYFKDYLQNFSEVAYEYGKLKQTLANKYKNHRDNYTEAKTEFIKKHTDLAKNLYKNRYKP
ncbi:MAG: GrpB family protein [Candidatus Izimaplasma sp.]|nr:GrpB family protein [Candidatus Izimaplasma bacterium]